MLVEHSQARHTSSSSPAPNPFMAHLVGKRAAFCTESDSNSILKVAEMKRLTGNETLDYRKLFANNILSLVPTFKMFFLCNDLPELSEFDHSVLRRLFVIHFPASFVEQADPEKNPTQRPMDRNLETMLKTEASKEAMLQLLAKAAQKYLKLLDNGQSLASKAPDIVKQSKQDWINNSMSFLEQFILDTIKITNDPIDTLTTDKLYQAFSTWRHGSSINIPPIRSSSVLGKRIQEHLNSCKDEKLIWKTKKKSSKMTHIGIALEPHDMICDI